MIDVGVEAVIVARYTDKDATHVGAGSNFRDSAFALELKPSSPETADQVHARCGRTQSGLVIHSPLAGAGARTVAYPDVVLMMEYGTALGVRGPDMFKVCGYEMLPLRNPAPGHAHELFTYVHFDSHSALFRVHCWSLTAVLLHASLTGSVRESFMAFRDYEHQDLETRKAIRRIWKELPFSATITEPWHITPNGLDLIRFIGWMMPQGDQEVFVGGRPLVAYKTKIAPSGWFATVDAC
jgi:hypothetical protein